MFSVLFVDDASDLLIRNPQVNIMIDRDKASVLGVTVGKIESALSSAYASGQISTIYTPNNEYWVILELQRENPLFRIVPITDRRPGHGRRPHPGSPYPDRPHLERAG